LKSGEEATFAFSNPYQPKLLGNSPIWTNNSCTNLFLSDVRLKGWESEEEGGFLLDDPRNFDLKLHDKRNPEVTRFMKVDIKPKGLTRIVAFAASHHLKNSTDKWIEVVTSWANIEKPTAHMFVQPGAFIPIACEENWEGSLAVRFKGEKWAFSELFQLPNYNRKKKKKRRKKVTKICKLIIPRQDGRKKEQVNAPSIFHPHLYRSSL